MDPIDGQVAPQQFLDLTKLVGVDANIDTAAKVVHDVGGLNTAPGDQKSSPLGPAREACEGCWIVAIGMYIGVSGICSDGFCCCVRASHTLHKDTYYLRFPTGRGGRKDPMGRFRMPGPMRRTVDRKRDALSQFEPVCAGAGAGRGASIAADMSNSSSASDSSEEEPPRPRRPSPNSRRKMLYQSWLAR